MDVLDTYPRDELFQAPVDELAPAVEKVAHLKERRQVRLFVRRDPYGRYLSCLVYLPRDRYTTAVRNKMQDILLDRLGGATIDYTARVTESVLARLHFVVADAASARRLRRGRRPRAGARADPGHPVLERRVRRPGGRGRTNPEACSRPAMVGALPEGYKEDYTPQQAIQDLAALMHLAGDRTTWRWPCSSPTGPTTRPTCGSRSSAGGMTLSLSKILPHLSLLGVDVIDERPYELAARPATSAPSSTTSGSPCPAAARRSRRAGPRAARNQFMDAFAASYGGRSESDGFNALVMGADLGWRQVGILRAIGRYLRQVGVDLQPDLRRPGAERQRGDRPAAGRPVRDQVRPRARRSTTRPIAPTQVDELRRQDQDRRWTTSPASITTGSSAPTWR